MAVAATPLTLANADARNAYLLRVTALTGAGLVLSALSGTSTALLIAAFPAIVASRAAQLVLILGSMAIANYAARPLAFSQSMPAAVSGFLLGSVFQGVAMGYLLLIAYVMGVGAAGNGLFFIGQAFGMVALTTVGMVLYLSTGPREFSMIRAGLSMLFLPMLLLMGVSFVFPIGGTIGLLMSLAFVGVSAAGLLVQVNDVMHRFRTDMVIAGSYTIMMGMLILFWNLLSLLLRLND
ncbi:MAG: hypothetical protein KC912_23365, partial [Proteobacteria bacterium]|nr:hypothetical protein [Pseudomonadota bacterium]